MPYLFERLRVQLDAHRGQRAAAHRAPGPTPATCESFCARMVEAVSYISPVVIVSEVSARIMIGASAGFTLR